MNAAARRYRHNVPTKIRLRNGQGFGGSPRRGGCNTLQSYIYIYIFIICAFIICNSRARDLDPKNQKLFYNDILYVYVYYICMIYSHASTLLCTRYPYSIYWYTVVTLRYIILLYLAQCQDNIKKRNNKCQKLLFLRRRPREYLFR